MGKKPKSYISVSEESEKLFFEKPHDSPITMLNLLKFNAVADYSKSPQLTPDIEISGLGAYQRYMKKVYPLLKEVGGELIYSGSTDHFLIGPFSEQWDAMLLVKYQNIKGFLSMTVDPKYLKIAGHRTAALKDSRLLPVSEGSLL